MEPIERYIGVMSGTSLDGIDVALIEIQGHHIRCLASTCYPMPTSIKQEILTICAGQNTTLQVIGQLDRQLGYLFAKAVNTLLAQTPYRSEQIRAIGCHGQTVFHQPGGNDPFTIQLGDANITAIQTGIDTVADFRRKDMALGGQGAPLVPAFHREIFQPSDETLIVLNIGGISNVTVMQPDKPVFGYDTGPGNVLLDGWCQQHTGRAYDQNAAIAYTGHVNQTLLTQMEQDDYFSAPAPKSTGREYFNLDWLDHQLRDFNQTILFEDVQRTLCQLTVNTITAQIKPYRTGKLPKLFVCGGGAKNPLLMAQFRQQLEGWQVTTTTEQGIESDYMEAIAFAWLAYRRIHHLPGNLPSVTGASHTTQLGVIYLAH
jgi:anhydro-N-acetylmuramic acid kinase